MSKQRLWLAGAGLGIGVVLASALMFLAAIAVAVAVVPLARRPGGLAAVSGELTAFGLLWLVLIAAQSASGGVLADASFWIAVGSVPLAVGVALSIRTLGPDRRGTEAG